MKNQNSKVRSQNHPSILKSSGQKGKFNFLVVFLTFAFCLLNLPLAEAFTMSNSNYTIRMGNVNTAAGKSTGANNKRGGSNYKLRAGFQYIHSLIPFAFSINQGEIDFGLLSPTNPVIRTNELSISNGSANGYTVTASENHQLLVTGSGALIPDTTCDDGTCTQSTSAAWTSTLVYGFGYRCDNVTGTGCASDFASNDSYKQFADDAKSEVAQSVMTGSNVGETKKVRITYKVNIAGTQAAGTYMNVITYIATPTF
ncbi:MAG: hypothetical protein HY431_02185 [Candidatus Levybacteria bacterium]|nr:hypothetical protein [Candidatus Levybacteria bacterium]